MKDLLMQFLNLTNFLSLSFLKVKISITRPDARLPKSRAGEQGPYLRSLDHLGRSSEIKVPYFLIKL